LLKFLVAKGSRSTLMQCGILPWVAPERIFCVDCGAAFVESIEGI